MLLDERPLVLLPSLAQAVGPTGAIAIQQLHFHLADPDNGRIHEGEQWIFKTYEDWQKDDFPFWSTDQIRRIFSALETKKLIVSCQPEGRNTRRKYYRINYKQLEKFLARAQEAAKSRHRSGEIASSSLSETTCTETTSRKGAVSHKSSDRTVSFFVPKVPYPETEEEMYATLGRLGIDPNPDRDGNFFEQMQASDWTIHGKPVWDWPSTYEGRLEVTTP